MTKFEDNLSPYLTIVEATEPSAPSAGQQRLYIDSTTHLLKATNSSGTDRTIEGVAAGAITGSGLTMATARLLGRTTGSTGAVEEITVGSGLSLSAGALTATGGGGGALTFLEAHTASSSASLDFTTFISSTYDTYKVVGTDLAPATNGADLRLRVGTGGGPTYDTGGNYEWGFQTATNSGTGPGAVGGTGATAATVMDNLANNAGYGFGGFEMTLMNLQSTAHRKMAFYSGTWTTSAPVLRFVSGGWFWVTAGTAVTAVQFFMSSGNIASGTIRIYGVAKS